jgi:predicted ATP-dependent serine protease
MAGTTYECTVCGHTSPIQLSECPNCASLDSFVEQHVAEEPEGDPTVTKDEEGLHERDPVQIREEASTELSEAGGSPAPPVS